MVTPKYRILSKDELHGLEKEFIEFLVINGVDPGDWEEMKSSDQSGDIISAFSDVIFESILRKTQFLEHWDPSGIKLFQCLSDKMVLVGGDLRAGSDLDIMNASGDDLVHHFKSFEFFSTDKAYSASREKEIFQMLEGGCVISDGTLFKKVLLAMTDL